MLFFAMVVLAYGLGTILGAQLVHTLFRVPDPRQHGSKNPGTTNVWRMSGARMGLLTLAWDALKAWGFLWCADHFAACSAAQQDVLWLAVIIGHCFPFHQKFKGGKGVATALGGLFYLAPLLALTVLIFWAITMVFLRNVGLSVLVTLFALPALRLGLSNFMLPSWPVMVVVTAVIIFRHQDNIQKAYQLWRRPS